MVGVWFVGCVGWCVDWLVPPITPPTDQCEAMRVGPKPVQGRYVGDVKKYNTPE